MIAFIRKIILSIFEPAPEPDMTEAYKMAAEYRESRRLRASSEDPYKLALEDIKRHCELKKPRARCIYLGTINKIMEYHGV
jgi:hypothetical protein